MAERIKPTTRDWIVAIAIAVVASVAIFGTVGVLNLPIPQWVIGGIAGAVSVVLIWTVNGWWTRR